MVLSRIKFVLIFTIVLSSMSSLKGQQFTFSREYSDSSNALYGTSIISTPDNCIMLSGISNHGGVIIKTDSSGNLIWNKEIGSGFDDWFQNMIVTNDSCILLVGKNRNNISAKTDYVIIKITLNGDTLWSKRVVFNVDAEARSVKQTFDNGYIIAGSESSNICILKINSNGNLEWMNIYSWPGSSLNCYSIIQTPDSGYLVIGDAGNNANACLLKLTETGTISWIKSYNYTVPGTFRVGDCVIMNDGYLCEAAQLCATGLIKIDFSGNIMWSKEYDNLCPSYPQNMCLTSDSNIAIVEDGFNGGHLLKLDTSGNLLWIKDVPLSTEGMFQANDNGFILVGNGPTGGVAGIRKIGIIKTDSLGISGNCTQINNNIITLNVTLISSSLVITTTTAGVFEQIYPNISYPTLKVDSGCGSSTVYINEQYENSAFNIYPNPSSGNITISIKEISDQSHFSIFNIYGQEIFPEQIFKSGYNIYHINEKLIPGIYTVILKSGMQTFSKKLVIE